MAEEKDNAGRYEIKYLISEEVRSALWPQVEARLRPDPHGSLGLGTYNVHSIYMDTPHLKAYHDKINGNLTRAKVRILITSWAKAPSISKSRNAGTKKKRTGQKERKK